MIKISLIAIIFSALIFISCRRKHIPERSNPETTETNPNAGLPKKSDSVVVRKKVYRPTQKDLTPNVIAVNDQAAHKSIDGRLYYDVLGHRYWKNYKDGKYYLFNKSMYSNPAFKAPK